MFKYETKFQKASQGKSVLLFHIQKRGFQCRYCFELFQQVLFILIQAMQNYKIKTQKFVINYCVLDLSEICINSSRPSFQLVPSFQFHKFSSRTRYSKYSASSTSILFIIIVASSIRSSSAEYAEALSESLFFGFVLPAILIKTTTHLVFQG